jgi:hypothetical protein
MRDHVVSRCRCLRRISTGLDWALRSTCKRRAVIEIICSCLAIGPPRKVASTANTAIFIESIVNVNTGVAAARTAISEIGKASLIKTPLAAREAIRITSQADYSIMIIASRETPQAAPLAQHCWPPIAREVIDPQCRDGGIAKLPELLRKP